MIRLDHHEIIVIEGNRDYLTIHTNDGRLLLTLQTMAQILEKLPADQFARVHRSYIVNLSRCNALDRHQVQLGKHQIPIGRGYREALFARLADLG